MASTRDRLNAGGEYVGTSVLWREDGRQRSRLFPSSAEAEAYRRMVECGTADTSPAARAAMTFYTFVMTIWLPSCGMAKNTVATIRSVMNTALKPLESRSLAWVASHRAEVQATIAASTRADHGQIYMTVKGAIVQTVALRFT
jgi:hypothetical protein